MASQKCSQVNSLTIAFVQNASYNVLVQIYQHYEIYSITQICFKMEVDKFLKNYELLEFCLTA